MTFTNEGLAKKLLILRKKSGLTQEEVAAHLNVNRSTYAYYETADTAPSYNTLLSLCEFYGVSTDWFIMGKARTEFEEQLNADLLIVKGLDREGIYDMFRMSKLR